jgi:hypothetical protein
MQQQRQQYVHKSILLPFDTYSRLLHKSRLPGEAKTESIKALKEKAQTGEGETVVNHSKTLELENALEGNTSGRGSELNTKSQSITEKRKPVPDEMDESVSTSHSGPPGVQILKRKLEDSKEKKKKKKKKMSIMTKWLPF